MPVLTAIAGATGIATVLPPYSLADGTYTVSARQVVSGVQGPLSAPVVFSMPNPAKSAVQTAIGRMSVAPPAGRAEAMYECISSLMAVGVWARLDVLGVLAAHHEQAGRLNWIGPAFDLSAYNSPIFAAGRGFKGDGSAAWMAATGYDPSVGGVKFILDNACVGAWILTPSTVAGLDVSMGNSRLSRRDTTSDDYHFRINDGTSYYGTGGSSPGLFVADRAAVLEKRKFVNGVRTGTGATASTGISGSLRLFSTGSGSWSNAEMAVVFAGGSLTEAQHGALYAALRSYLVNLGAVAP